MRGVAIGGAHELGGAVGNLARANVQIVRAGFRRHRHQAALALAIAATPSADETWTVWTGV